MKNPFTNTEDYMIVREFNRLSSKKRSNSSSSQSSFKSSQSSKMDDHLYMPKVTKPSIRYNEEYLVQRSRPNLYDLQRKRALIFGIDQLRYKPSYLNSIDSNTNEIKSQQKDTSAEIKLFPGTLKSQKSLKQLRFKEATLKQLSTRKIINEQVDKVKQQQIQIPVKKKRSSVVQQMLQLNIKNDNKSNQFYASIADLKSRHEMLRSNTSIPINNPKIKKKCSIFHSEYQQFVENRLLRQNKRNFQSQYQQSQRSKFTESRKLQQTQQQIDKQNTELQIPNFITIRNKIYYRYIKELI